MPPPSSGGSGLAIAALIIAVVALLLCWVPIVNNLIFFLGILGLALGGLAWFRASKGRAGGRTMSIAAVVVSIIAMVGVVVTQAFYSNVIDSVSESISEAADGETDMSEEDQEAASTEAVALGDSADVGEYTVTVTDVLLDANQAMSEANQFNDAPTGQFVLVSLDVTYNGDEEGDPWLDLSVELAGSDARIYSTSTCSAVEPNPGMDLPTLTSGGQGAFDVCFDVPVEALEDPRILVEESFSFSDTRVYWTT